MEVSTWFGSGNYGIRVGIDNRDHYFEPSWKSIIVDIEEEEHTFRLTNGFWRQCPEFRDRTGSPIIKNWLSKYKTLNWPKYQAPKMELIPVGKNKFKLLP